MLFLAALLQATFVPQIRFTGGGPDLVFLVVLCWAVNADLEEGLIWALVGGIMNDLLSAAPLGASALGLVLVVFGISGLNRQLYTVGIVLLTGLVLVGTFVHQAIMMIVIALSGFVIRLPDDVVYILLPSIAYNFVLVFPIYFFVRRIQRRIYRYRIPS